MYMYMYMYMYMCMYMCMYTMHLLHFAHAHSTQRPRLHPYALRNMI